ncbi:MAG: arylsulfatase A-like enzyme [Pseudohongiellaceae bacterium]|jgi:arylsulfatase A-like enzyme
MASILTSQYPSSAGVQRMEQKLSPQALTWPEVMQANGMDTAGFSANSNMGNLLSNYAQGFDHFVESTDINNADPIHCASGSAKRLNEHAFQWLGRTDLWPMLLYMHSVDPHEEYEPNAQYLEEFADPARHGQFREEWELLLKSRPPVPGLYVTQDKFDRTDVDSASFMEHASNLYDADILANDAQMQRLWDKLQDDGWGDDFILLFTSDHGEEFFDHGGTSHGNSLYDEMLRVPLMIYAPGLVPLGKRIETPVRSLDIFPTLCDLLGFEVPPDLQGQSLVPLIHGAVGAGALDVFAEHTEDPVLRSLGLGSGVMVSVRNGKWKLISNVQSPQLIERPRYELFDLNDDPHEQRNVGDAHPEVLQQLQAKVERFIDDFQQGSEGESEELMDPEVLTQLRALGYIGEVMGAPSLWAAMETEDPEQICRALRDGADANELEPISGMRPLAMARISL